MPSIDDIRLTVAALSGATFESVAQQQHVSQSTVSRAVQRIEGELGEPLFERDGRKTRPRADVGGSLASLRSIVDVWDTLVDAPEPGASLSIFCTVTASQSIAPELLADFRRAFPDTKLDLQTGPASAALDAAMSGAVDAAIAPLPDRLPKSMVSLEIMSTRLVAITAKDYVRPKTWDGAHLIAPRQGVTRALVDGWRRSIPPNHTLQETESHEEVVALTALGSGIGIVPNLVVESSALESKLLRIKPPVPLPTMRIGLCARKTSVRHGALAELWGMVSANR